MIANAAEIRKFTILSWGWLTIIFGLVWAVSWLVGVAIPLLLANVQADWARLVTEICQVLTPLVAVMVFIPINAMFMVLAERRALALFTVRKGPNRVGPDGFLQTLADALKLLFKEDITPRGADAFMFTLAPIIFFAPSIFGALPLLAAVTNNHNLFQVVNLPTGIFYVLAVSSVPVVGIVMGGWASNNKYSLVGALRSAAQAISYEIPLVLSIITVCLMAGTLDVVKIAEMQKGGLLNWNILGGGALSGLNKYFQALAAGQADAHQMLSQYYPDWGSVIATVVLIACTVLLVGIYLTGACAEINRIPFDLPEAESELVSGYNTEYSGIKFAIFFLAEFTNLFIVSTIATVMFLGGGDCPLPDWLNPLTNPAVTQPVGKFFSFFTDRIHLIDPSTFFPAIWVIIKVYALVFFAILVRGTLPRFRIDQLMAFGWKRLVPLSLIIFVLVTFAKGAVRLHV
ncbi:MAG: NADH-quinone oxidoreductase subunit H [Candidatus Melainabacteria bacterium]|nr:MAG: NADH-quinone oxidoreductase subunit H [Candidatus Melainabacteria bacterium]